MSESDMSELERLQIDWQRVYGVGTYGTTYGAVDSITGERLCVKVLHASRCDDGRRNLEAHLSCPRACVLSTSRSLGLCTTECYLRSSKSSTRPSRGLRIRMLYILPPMVPIQ